MAELVRLVALRLAELGRLGDHLEDRLGDRLAELGLARMAELEDPGDHPGDRLARLVRLVV
jgi:hypothetical protein